jgi:hypothetical protein
MDRLSFLPKLTSRFLKQYCVSRHSSHKDVTHVDDVGRTAMYGIALRYPKNQTASN